MASDGSAGDGERLRSLRRRALGFSVLGLLLCLVLVAVVEPPGWGQRHGRALELLTLTRTGQRLDLSHAPELIAIGAGAGLLAGLLGMGGGVLKVAGMLVLFQLDILLARAVSLTTMFIASASAARVHIRSGAVRWDVVRPMVGPALIGVVGGMTLGMLVTRATLTAFFAFFALMLGLNTLAQTFADPNEHVFRGNAGDDGPGPTRIAAGGIGALHGFVCGLLGISGGVIAMPMQQVLARIPARRAVANAVVVSAVCTSVGSVTVVVAGLLRDDFVASDVLLATACVGGGAAVGAQIGARMTGSLPVVVLRLLFAQVSLAAGLVVLFR